MMNLLKDKMLDTLIDLKDNYNAVGVKVEFEAEGSTLEEAALLEYLSKQSGLELTIKIGGCEAIKDLREAKNISAKTIVAPMIETSYAMKKYTGAINQIFSQKEKQDCNFLINIETITGINNFNDIIESEDFSILDGVVLGRQDLTASMDLDNSNVDNETILNIANKMSLKLQALNKEFTVGGNVSANSILFFSKLPYLTTFETRKVIFNADNINIKNSIEGLVKAFEFELLWLKYKKEEQINISSNLNKRILDIKTRILNIKNFINSQKIAI